MTDIRYEAELSLDTTKAIKEIDRFRKRLNDFNLSEGSGANRNILIKTDAKVVSQLMSLEDTVKSCCEEIKKTLSLDKEKPQGVTANRSPINALVSGALQNIGANIGATIQRSLNLKVSKSVNELLDSVTSPFLTRGKEIGEQFSKRLLAAVDIRSGITKELAALDQASLRLTGFDPQALIAQSRNIGEIAGKETAKSYAGSLNREVQLALRDKRGINTALRDITAPRERESGISNSLKQELQQIKQLNTSARETGRNIAKGVIRGIKQESSNLKKTTRNELVREVIKDIKRGFEIASPSRVMFRLFQDVTRGAVQGLKTFGKDISRPINQGVRAVQKNVRSQAVSLPVDLKGLSSIRTRLTDIGGLLRRIGSVLIPAAFGGAVILNAAKAVFRLSSAFLNVATAAASLETNLKNVAQSQENFIRLQSLVVQVANDSSQSIESIYGGTTELQAAIRGREQLNEVVADTVQGVAQAARVFSLEQDQIQGLFLASRQILSDEVLQAQDFNQISERIPGAAAIASRAVEDLGGSIRELSKTGELASEVFQERFARQLIIETAVDLDAASRTYGAAAARLSNEIGSVGAAIGKPLVEPAILAFDAATTAIRATTGSVEILQGGFLVLGGVIGIQLGKVISALILNFTALKAAVITSTGASTAFAEVSGRVKNAAAAASISLKSMAASAGVLAAALLLIGTIAIPFKQNSESAKDTTTAIKALRIELEKLAESEVAKKGLSNLELSLKRIRDERDLIEKGFDVTNPFGDPNATIRIAKTIQKTADGIKEFRAAADIYQGVIDDLQSGESALSGDKIAERLDSAKIALEGLNRVQPSGRNAKEYQAQSEALEELRQRYKGIINQLTEAEKRAKGLSVSFQEITRTLTQQNKSLDAASTAISQLIDAYKTGDTELIESVAASNAAIIGETKAGREALDRLRNLDLSDTALVEQEKARIEGDILKERLAAQQEYYDQLQQRNLDQLRAGAELTQQGVASTLTKQDIAAIDKTSEEIQKLDQQITQNNIEQSQIRSRLAKESADEAVRIAKEKTDKIIEELDREFDRSSQLLDLDLKQRQLANAQNIRDSQQREQADLRSAQEATLEKIRLEQNRRDEIVGSDIPELARNAQITESDQKLADLQLELIEQNRDAQARSLDIEVAERELANKRSVRDAAQRELELANLRVERIKVEIAAGEDSTQKQLELLDAVEDRALKAIELRFQATERLNEAKVDVLQAESDAISSLLDRLEEGVNAANELKNAINGALNADADIARNRASSAQELIQQLIDIRENPGETDQEQKTQKIQLDLIRKQLEALGIRIKEEAKVTDLLDQQFQIQQRIADAEAEAARLKIEAAELAEASARRQLEFDQQRARIQANLDIAQGKRDILALQRQKETRAEEGARSEELRLFDDEIQAQKDLLRTQQERKNDLDNIFKQQKDSLAVEQESAKQLRDSEEVLRRQASQRQLVESGARSADTTEEQERLRRISGAPPTRNVIPISEQLEGVGFPGSRLRQLAQDIPSAQRIQSTQPPSLQSQSGQQFDQLLTPLEMPIRSIDSRLEQIPRLLKSLEDLLRGVQSGINFNAPVSVNGATSQQVANGFRDLDALKQGTAQAFRRAQGI